MFDKIFVSPQVKRIVIISNKHGIYELLHKLPNDLRLRTSTPRHFRRWGGSVPTQEKEDLGPQKIRKYQENLKIS